MKAVGYIRVSTDKQTDPDKVSLENREIKIRKYCELKEWELFEPLYKDEGISGAKADRPALNQLLKDAQEHKFDVVVVYDLSRFGRDLLHLKQNTTLLKNLGIGFVAEQNSIDTANSSSTGELLLNILGAVYEFERQIITERTQGQRLILWNRGQIPMGEIGYGYRWNYKRKRYEHHPDEAPVYKRLVEDFMLTPDASLTKLAVQFERECLPTRNRRGRWFTGVMSKILSYAHPYVTGLYHTKEFTYQCEPLITPSECVNDFETPFRWI